MTRDPFYVVSPPPGRSVEAASRYRRFIVRQIIGAVLCLALGVVAGSVIVLAVAGW